MTSATRRPFPAALLGAALLAVAPACAGAPVPAPSDAVAARAPDPLDPVAEGYVKLVLAIGQHDADHVDAYFGPPAWKEEAERAGKRPLAAVAAEADRLLAAAVPRRERPTTRTGRCGAPSSSASSSRSGRAWRACEG